MRHGFQSKTPFVSLLLALVVATSAALLTAQEPAPANKPKDQTNKPQPDQVTSQPKPAALENIEAKRAGGLVFTRTDRQVGRASLAVARGVRLLVENRTAGRITIHGWDRDTIEAQAMSERGEEVLIVGQSEGNGPKAIFLKADYANLTNSEALTQALDLPPLGNDGPIQVHLEVNVPRYVELELIKVIRSGVEIVGVDAPIIVIGQSSGITLKAVGSVEAHTRTGSITIENARGIADVTSSTGPIRVVNSRGAVRAVSITGTIEVRCFKGRVDVGNTQGPIELNGIDGDVEAIAASSDVRFMGAVSGDGRYYLKSMSGRVEMIVPADTRGFNTVLTSYRGKIESDFSLRSKPAAQEPEASTHRLSGTFGNGGPQITLDSFEGLVKLSKLPSTSAVSCQ